MNAWIWKLKRFVKKALPIVIVGALAYGALQIVSGGRAKSSIARAVRHVPLVGSRFSRMIAPGRRSYVNNRRYRGGKKSKGGRSARRHSRSRRWR